MKYVASISYDGSKFYGFQRLNKKKSVQSELEKVLTKINKTKVIVKGAGRTDRGVHALDQRVHFELNINIAIPNLILAMNSMLDEAIYVNKIEVVNNDFHARFDVKTKTYLYVINVGEYKPILNDYIFNYNNKLNIKKMKKASKFLIGKHSYEAFTSGERENYNSIIYKIKIKKKKNMIYITFVGKSFYRYMVRNMVGSLLLAGREKIEPIGIKEMLESKNNKYNYMTVPASGLYLIKIEY